MKCCVSIVEYEANQTSSDLLEPYENVFRAIATVMNLDRYKDIAVPFLVELNKMQNHVNKRLISCRIFSWLAHIYGEEGF